MSNVDFVGAEGVVCFAVFYCVECLCDVNCLSFEFACMLVCFPVVFVCFVWTDCCEVFVECIGDVLVFVQWFFEVDGDIFVLRWFLVGNCVHSGPEFVCVVFVVPL